MLQDSPNSSLIKIAEAAKVLGVHKDTLRRWEKSGKIKVIRSLGGTRLYDISKLKLVPIHPRLNTHKIVQPIELPSQAARQFVKIAEAANILNVHKDTLRRWEKIGKIEVTRKSNGARFYKLDDLKRIDFEKNPPPSTEQLLKSATVKQASIPVPNLSYPTPPIQDYVYSTDQNRSDYHKDIHKNIVMFGGFLAVILISTIGVVAYFKEPFRESLRIQATPSNLISAKEGSVLAATTGQVTVKFNANEKVAGSLVVSSDINGVKHQLHLSLLMGKQINKQTSWISLPLMYY